MFTHRCRSIVVATALSLPCAATAEAAPPLPLAPVETIPPERADLEPKRFRLRTGSLEIGAAWRPAFYEPGGVCGYNHLCGITPRVGFDFELGSRLVRLVLGTYHAPVPVFSGDVAAFEAFMADVGVLFGNARIRGGIVGNGGAVHAGGAAILRLSPWADRRRHRHGIDLRVSWAIFAPLGIGLSYRFYPRLLDRQYPQR